MNVEAFKRYQSCRLVEILGFALSEKATYVELHNLRYWKLIITG